MFVETLESRSMMAGDYHHNFSFPEDADTNGVVTPLDALVVINRVNRSFADTDSPNGLPFPPRLVDVDADGTASPLDALIVLNHLNAQTMIGENGRRASRVESDRRIELIEKAIASNNLPPVFNIEEAQAILDTLRSGGRPELGDYVENGSLHWKNATPIPSEGLPNREPIGPGEYPEAAAKLQFERFIAALSERLAAFNVSPDVIGTIAGELRSAEQDGTQFDLQQVRARLAELGVDVEKILPQPPPPERVRPDFPSRPIDVTQPIAESIVRRLTDAGVTIEIIETISKEMFDAIDAGTPLDIQQVLARLPALGVDWEKLHAPPVAILPVPDRPGFPVRPELPPDRPELPVMPTILVTQPIAESIVNRLTDAGAAAEVIETISKEMFDAIDTGTPLDLQQVRARLAELGFGWDNPRVPHVSPAQERPDSPRDPAGRTLRT
jgi:hypothetical protein